VNDFPVGDRFDPLVARLLALHPRLIDLSLDRLRGLLARLDHPEARLPPVIHVAGTNGKGSTCAFVRAMAEAAGQRVHVFTSPHLVAFNERIRLAGELVTDAALAAVLEEIEAVNDGAAITVFELITAAAFVLFARVPADLCVLEVGLGGRGDATNVVARPAACAVTSISLDHRDFLGDTVEKIAAEKAGIFKPGAPAVTGAQTPGVLAVLQARADALGVALAARGRDWTIEATAEGLRFADAAGVIDLPRPALPGEHQHDNAGIAVASLRAASLGVAEAAMRRGLATARWPARLQPLTGRLAALAPAGRELWLDGGHNEGAALALAEHLREWAEPVDLIVGMKQTKDPAAFLAPLLPRARAVWAVAEPGQHLALPPEAIVAASGGVARVGPTVRDALRALGPGPGRVLICGSLYLAGEVLRADIGRADIGRADIGRADGGEGR
jgi:dihydrofolate synthase/folylpolyglutamate synthase